VIAAADRGHMTTDGDQAPRHIAAGLVVGESWEAACDGTAYHVPVLS
jgi:hypothetical protein